MWGICLDSMIEEGKLFQHVIEFDYSLDRHMVFILQPISGVKISVDKIKAIDRNPAFGYGEYVFPVHHPDIIGKVEAIIWHFKNDDYNYYISVNGRKKSKRYYAADLKKL